MRLALKLALAALGLVAGLSLAVAAAWAADGQRHDGRVVRNVALAGEDVGGLTRAEVASAVERLAARYATAQVVVRAPGGGFATDAAALGLTVKEDATVQAAMDVGRTGPVPTRIRTWVASLLHPRRAPVRVGASVPAVYEVVAAKDPARIPAREPGIRAFQGKIVPVAGEPGRGIDAADVLRELPEAAEEGLPIVVEVDRGSVAPRFKLADAARLATEAEALTRRGLRVAAGGQEAAVAANQLRSWLRAEVTPAGLRLAVDGPQVVAGVSKLLPTVGSPPVETRFTVVDGAVQVVPGTPGTACCADQAGQLVEQALREGAQVAGPLPLKKVDPQLTAEEAAALGIKEPVATFTTNHKPGEPRVANIHRIADLVRGQFIEPGKTLSVNGVVGPRTVEKGFVSAPVIEDGKFQEGVGGGVSQFATTAFNAAFLAGLEFAEYQSHSLVITRYPYGREATLGYPHPDLVIRNPSPYGVLVWPTYTDRSITVTLYSTRWVEVTQTAQTTEPRGPCTRVRTERTRRYLTDGTTKVDYVRALYRPSEGINCS